MVITLTFIMATVESYVVMSAGLIFLGFGASRWTVPYTERYISLVVSTGVRLMVLYMIIGLGQTLSNTWIQEASQLPLSTAGLQSLFGLLASVIVFMALAWQVPKLAGSILQGSLQMGSSDLMAPAMSAAIAAGTIGAVATAGVGAVAGGVGALAAGGAAAGGGAGAAGAGGMGGSFMPGGAGGMVPGMGSTMPGAGGSGAAPGVEGAVNSVPPPSPSASGGGGGVVAVDPPPVTVGAQGEKSARSAVAASGSSPASADAGGVNPALSQVAGGSTRASEGEGVTAPAPIQAPGVVRESPLGVVNAAREEGSGARSRSDDRSLGEKISGIHNTAAQVQQHLPEDSATVSAPTLNIQHGE